MDTVCAEELGSYSTSYCRGWKIPEILCLAINGKRDWNTFVLINLFCLPIYINCVQRFDVMGYFLSTYQNMLDVVTATSLHV